MRITLPTIVLALATFAAAIPITPLQGADVYPPPSTHAKQTKLIPFQNACYYKRSINAFVERDASNAEVLCGKQKLQQGQSQQRDVAIPPNKTKPADVCLSICPQKEVFNVIFANWLCLEVLVMGRANVIWGI